ncbi:hypothetical protein PL373_13190 [Tenacibaculum maritimum]|nr:hypothetical protein [Tenacibaculum maritimum]MDB0600320.1 hypothetical protein [Tenacibaculum maritimum]MDB0602084.1 hypothetical protein [Tenacibaculum maritimum]MDB0610830.1 hypothetical protein [Tenacibaculum maritimum]
MKAKELVKKELTLENIYSAIKNDNDNGCYKHHIPHWMYVSGKTRLQLIEDGFKVYKGAWDGIMTDVIIIEW